MNEDASGGVVLAFAPTFPTIQQWHLGEFLEQQTQGFSCSLHAIRMCRTASGTPVNPNSTSSDTVVPRAVENGQHQLLLLLRKLVGQKPQQGLLALLDGLQKAWQGLNWAPVNRICKDFQTVLEQMLKLGRSHCSRHPHHA